MPRNGAGTYSLPSGNPVITGTTISSTTFNNTLTDLAAALSGSLSADGQTAWAGAQNANGNRLTNLPSASALLDAANANDVQTGRLSYLTTVAGTNTVTATLAGLGSYTAGQTFRFIAAGANTGAATLNVNSLGAKAITKNGATALIAGEIPIGAAVTVTYDGTQFQIQRVAQPASATASGYVKLDSGLILQWGVSSNITGGSNALVTYPTAFSTQAFSVTANAVTTLDGTAPITGLIELVSASQFRLHNYASGGSSAAFYWIAIGL